MIVRMMVVFYFDSNLIFTKLVDKLLSIHKLNKRCKDLLIKTYIYFYMAMLVDKASLLPGELSCQTTNS